MSQTKLLQPSKIKMSKTKIYSILLIASFLTAFTTFYFILPAELYTPGLGGITYGIVYTISDFWRIPNISSRTQNTIIYWIIYLLFNIPIIIFSIKVYSKNFVTKSLFFFVTNLAFALIIANVKAFNGDLIDMDNAGESLKSIIILFYAIIGGIIYGIGLGIVFSVGACSMGLDPITKYYSRERDVNIAPMLFIIAIVNITVWTMVRYFISINEVKFVFEDFMEETILSAPYVGSWLFVAAYSFVTGSIYSSNKKVQIFITTTKTNEISDYWNSIDYHRGHTIYEVQGGYSKEKRKSIEMITNIQEMYDVVEKVAAIDPSAFITITELKKVYDVHDWRSMTEEDKIKALSRIQKDKKRKKHLIEARKRRTLKVKTKALSKIRKNIQKDKRKKHLTEPHKKHALKSSNKHKEKKH